MVNLEDVDIKITYYNILLLFSHLAKNLILKDIAK